MKLGMNWFLKKSKEMEKKKNIVVLFVEKKDIFFLIVLIKISIGIILFKKKKIKRFLFVIFVEN